MSTVTTRSPATPAPRRRARPGHAMTLPEGLSYFPGFVTEAEERDVLGLLARFELQPYVLHDTPSRRLVRSFGLALVTGAYDAGPAAPVPAELDWLRERCAALMGREPGELADLLVTRYPPGAGDRLAPRCAAVRRGRRHLAADRVPDAVPPRPDPRLADGRTRPRTPLRLRPVRPGADTMAAPHPRGHAGAMVDDVPHPAARHGRHPVSGRTRPRARPPPGGAPSAWSRAARRCSCGSVSRQPTGGQTQP